MLKEQLLLLMMISGCLTNDAPTVVTNSGKIIGHYLTSYEGNRYEAYQGIPYALPPTGERRFKPPVPIPSSPRELLATRLRSSCLQHGIVPLQPDGSYVAGDDEDCLYLNVFVPKRKANATLPVLFWIHGGGFMYGSSVPEEEIYLMDYEVILVTIQYRLGALGFLSTEDEVVPGNMGLKDQSLALKWVHENIQNFGGDPNRITLYGQSSGGISVHYHYLSPMSAGLFQNGISFSGTTFNWWAQCKNSRQKALELGKLMNCTTDNTEQLVKCLRERPANEIVKLQSNFMGWRETVVPFGPVAEKFAKEPFIDRSPREVIESGRAYDAPWITSIVSEEGLYPVIDWTEDYELKEINEDWDRIAPFLLGFYYTIPKENHTKLAQTIRKQYFGDKAINQETFMTLVYLVSDTWYTVDIENAARAQAKANKSPVLFYYYNYRPVDSMASELSNTTKNFGVCHGDDVYLFMKNKHLIPTKSARDMAMQKVLIKLLTSFATNGDKPDLHVEWLKVDSSNSLKHLKISGPKDRDIKMTTSDNLGQKKFWNSIDFTGKTYIKMIDLSKTILKREMDKKAFETNTDVRNELQKVVENRLLAYLIILLYVPTVMLSLLNNNKKQ